MKNKKTTILFQKNFIDYFVHFYTFGLINMTKKNVILKQIHLIEKPKKQRLLEIIQRIIPS